MLSLLGSADVEQNTRNSAAVLNPALEALVKRVVKECVTLDLSADRQTLEQALCKHSFGVWFMLCQEHPTLALKQCVRTYV